MDHKGEWTWEVGTGAMSIANPKPHISDIDQEINDKNHVDYSKLNIYQKLLELRKRVPYLQKTTTGHKYSYVSESTILAAIKPLMDELGLFLEMSVREYKTEDCKDLIPVKDDRGRVVDHVTKEKSIITIKFHFTWINVDNPEEKEGYDFVLQGVAGDPKIIGGLSTYAMRYHLTRMFQIAQDSLDPDAYQEMTDLIQETLSDKISSLQEHNIIKLVANREDLMKQLQTRFPKGLHTIPADGFDQLMGWINRQLAKGKQQ